MSLSNSSHGDNEAVVQSSLNEGGLLTKQDSGEKGDAIEKNTLLNLFMQNDIIILILIQIFWKDLCLKVKLGSQTIS